MSASGIHSWRGGASRARRAAFAALGFLALAAASGPAPAQTNRQQREFQEGNREIQQQLQNQQRDQQIQFQMNQLRDQQMRQQQFQPLPAPTIGISPRGR